MTRSRIWARCTVCHQPRQRTIGDEGALTPCPCGGAMVKSARHEAKRIAQAKADLQHYGVPSHTQRIH